MAPEMVNNKILTPLFVAKTSIIKCQIKHDKLIMIKTTFKIKLS